jgi:hypothetical protein
MIIQANGANYDFRMSKINVQSFGLTETSFETFDGRPSDLR